MALLTPNKTCTVNGVTLNEKIIPDGTRWKDGTKARNAGFSANSLYKRQQKLSGGTGRVQSVTIHNTEDLNNVHDDGEQYTRATYNENMGSVRVHFYIDDVCAWQNLKAGTGLFPNDPVNSAEVSWHAGDGSTTDGGNMTSISIEVIMNDNAEHDEKAKDNSARLAAWLLWKHGLTIDHLVTHTYWVNKSAGKRFADVDEQCCNLISGKKWCPTYIFKSSDKQTAMKNWKTYKQLVGKYLAALEDRVEIKPAAGADSTQHPTASSVKKGDVVKISSDATYYSGKTIPAWVKNKSWVVSSVSGDRAIIDKSEDGKNAICSPISTKYLTVTKTVSAKAEFEPYRVRVKANALNIRKGAGTNYAIAGTIKNKGVYTIVDEAEGKGANKWGKLKSGAGWISLDYTDKV